MLKIKDTPELVKEGVGVIVGRFHVPELHEGHRDLFDTVQERHDKTICVLGLAEIKASKNNPLDFETRRKMIEEAYPDISVLYQHDVESNEEWSKSLDKLISNNTSPGTKVSAYGSRDSFIKHYSGRMQTVEFEPDSVISGTLVRNSLTNKTKSSKDFRHGVLWAVGNRYDVAYPTVDIAITDENEERILLGRKENETLFRFIGGFVDPTKDSFGEIGALELNARREVQEETGLEVGPMEYIGSFFVNDVRYRNEADTIITTLFKTKRLMGRAAPDDDIEELKWFPINNLNDRKVIVDEVIEIHRPLMKALLTKLPWST